MERRTHSLAFRISMLCAAALLCCAVIIGSIGIFAVKREGDRNTSRQMNLICADRTKTLNEFLGSVEQSAGLVARYAAEDISSIELVNGGVIGADGLSDFRANVMQDEAAKAALDDYLTAHVQRVLEVFRSTANYTHGIYTYYYRLNPQFGTRSAGFWYTINDQNSFSPLALTDLNLYTEQDEGAVAWYYQPLRNGKATWMMPYYNENLDTRLISYIIPIYKAGTFIGLVGIDINFSTLADQVNAIHLFDTGFAFLTKPNGEIVCHPTIDPGERETVYDPSHAPIAQYLQSMDSTGEQTVLYEYGGVKKEMAFNTLSNGMKLIVVAPSREINADWQHMIRILVAAGLGVIVVFGSLMALAMRQITTPLKHLTEASRLLAAGNYDVELDYSRNDEVGVLTDSFRKLTTHLKMYISDLNSRAYRDALTGVRNKGAFNIVMRKLNDASQSAGKGQEAEYAIVMFDCDCLKQINDVYGHEKGDIYLQTACRLICVTFSHSPVFRVGGDEFAAILQQEDYQRREALLSAFDRAADEQNAAHPAPWEQVHISKGVALCDREHGENAESVLSRADAEMYEDKKARKHRTE